VEYKVVITTSGIGSRLGDFTAHTNKSLVKLGNTPILSHIIDSYPLETPFVVTLGHCGDFVRQFLELAYPARSFEFVHVAPYEGPGSSLGYSLLQAQHLLQQPFIFHAGDTLVGGGPIPPPECNWIAGYRGNESSQYATFDCLGERVINMNTKGADEFDFIHVGLIGINSYQLFWSSLGSAYEASPNDSTLNDVSALTAMIKNGHEVEFREFPTWHDVGSIEGLNAARDSFSMGFETLDKSDEAIFRIEDKVFKFFADSRICLERVARAHLLAPHVPQIVANRENWFVYPFVRGRVTSQSINPKTFGRLLDWADSAFWSRIPSDAETTDFAATCDDFYFGKTRSRLSLFVERSGVADREGSINGEVVPSVQQLLDTLQRGEVLQGRQGIIHGDFILDNIVMTDESFIGLDWRQGFGPSLTIGDIYYDLAKLNHSLTMNHDILNRGLFELDDDSDGVHVDILRSSALLDCEAILEDFGATRGFDYWQIRLLSSIVWLNMAPLHGHHLGVFLFYFGKYRLWKTMQERLAPGGV